MKKTLLSAVIALIFIMPVEFSIAQAPGPAVETVKLTDNIYMLQGNGGNIGISVGKDGVFMIDDQHAAMISGIMEAIRKISDKPVKFVLNTQWHQDHTGGNELMGEAGSIIVAHENVRKRLTERQSIEFFAETIEPLSEVGLPAITFSDAITFRLNGDEIYIYHVEPSHTDSDAIVHFKKANVVHGGDVVFSGMYPFIDYEHGGSAEGMARVVGRLIESVDDSTKIIPGHGPLCNKQYLKDYHRMLSTITARIKKMKEEGKTLDEIIAAKPTAEFDQTYNGFIVGDDFVGLVYKSLE